MTELVVAGLAIDVDVDPGVAAVVDPGVVDPGVVDPGVDTGGVRRRVRVVDDVALIARGRRLVGVVGESGAGKSLLALALVRLLPRAAHIAGGSVVLTTGAEVVDVTAADEPALRQVRGARVALVHPEPQTALDPFQRVDDAVGEVLRAHRGLSRDAARRAALPLLDEVELPRARAAAYPHELSGGQRQRVLLAAALAGDPSVIVADEPTSALDVGAREHVVAVLRARAARGAAVLLITHDLDVAAACDEVHVMYAGQLVESGPVDAVLSLPRHPYTRALVAAQPSRTPPGTPLPALSGRAPVVGRWPRGCRFADRCPDVADVCGEPPAIVVLADRSCVRCARIGALR